ncbi:MAG: HAMP domain-containing protein [Proteobacteria bacterium]|nr:HAMP domain-containing protein [Pseudomonadota bacterium]MBU1386445.1 HAMP domain-containing protein [Pseudomonadota bacterium]MBU1544556.1 HAMP domain-containing protein [Pseudomonadota bacterium]MBU2482753.1 HAMP domain-containing protein [Pseudomonadota bacterium]
MPEFQFTDEAEHARNEQARKKKEFILIVIILMTVGILTFIETRITDFGTDLPLSSTVLMFILINTNLLLLLALLLLVFRNLAKLYYEKKNNILGSKLKTRLVAAFIVLALLPTTVLFFFSIHFISSSIAFWFNTPVEQTLDSSLTIGQKLYEYIEEKNEFFAKRAAFQIDSRNLLEKGNEKKLARYSQVIQRAFNRYAVEVYTPDAQRVSLSLPNELENLNFSLLTSNDLTDIPEERQSNTISQYIEHGELLRTIAAIPFGTDPQKARGFIVITTLVSLELSKDLQTIIKGIEEYHQLKMAKRPAEIYYYIALSIVALLVVFCAIWFGFQLAKSITIPIMKFAEGTQRVARGDLNYQIDFETDDEIGTLIKSFNSMTRELASGREQIALSGKLLQQQNDELEKSRQYIEIVLKNISAGVISVDNQGIITTINKAAESMLAISGRTILNQNFKDILKNDHLQIARQFNEQLSQGHQSFEMPLSITISGVPKHFSLTFNTLKNDQGQNIGSVLVFDDVTELEKAQRVAAWREVARRIAHEVKNPLTPIKLSAQRLKRKYGKQINEDIFNSCTDTIVEHVDLIKNLVNEFAAFAKFPDANIAKCRIENIILETIALYREGFEHIDIRSRFSDNIPVLKLGQQHMKQAFINLIDNAVAAVGQDGMILIDVSYDDILKIVRIEIADNGHGISDKEKTRLFEPYFSTKKSGMGLGLAIVSSIISDHNGVIRVQDNKPKGAKFIIELPA